MGAFAQESAGSGTDASLLKTAETDAEKVIDNAEQLPILNPLSLPADLNSMQSNISDFFAATWDYIAEHQVSLLVLGIGSVVSFFLAAIITAIFRGIIRRIFIKNANNAGEFFSAKLSRPIMTALFVLGVFGSSSGILNTMNGALRNFFIRGFWAIFSFVVLWGLFRCIGALDGVLHRISERTGSNVNELLTNLIRKALKIIIGSIAVLFIFQNILGLDITALLAGAGVVGLAVAFAAQNTIANFISSIMVIMDKPFTVGDRVRINGVDGCVEEVGLRSTKIRALDGNLFALPNSIVADNPIENITRRPNIKYAFDITLTYNTPPEKMREALNILHRILDNRPEFTADMPPRIYFGEFRDWALTINVVTWFNCEWFDFLQTRNDINFEILQQFNNAGLNFAFPTSTTYLAGVGSEPVVVNKIKTSKD